METNNLFKKILEIIKNKKKTKLLIESGKCHFCFSSPGKWRAETRWFCLKKVENKYFLLEFKTEWAGDFKTRDNFFEKMSTKSKRYHNIYKI